LRRAILTLLFLAGCTQHAPPCGVGATRLELRDGSGALTLRVAASARPGELDLCDAQKQRVGAVVRAAETLRLIDRGGAERLQARGAEALEITGPAGQAMRLFRHDGELRVLRPDGVAFGSIGTQKDAAIVSDAGGSPIGKVTARDADAVVTAPGGAVRTYVVPSPGMPAAAVFAIETLSPEERVFLAVHLARGVLLP
jgi:hypothetical protein